MNILFEKVFILQDSAFSMIIGISGINGLGNTKGVEFSPKKIFKELNLKGKIFPLNLDNFKEDSEKILFSIDFGKKNIFIGGDHSISYTLCKGFFKKNKNAKLIIFDAHPDLMINIKEPTHEEWLRALVDEKITSPENILLIGIRKNSSNVDIRELNYAKENGIKIIFANEFPKKEKEIIDFLGNSPLYLSFDVDVFDKSIFKSTGYPEENGLLEKEVLSLLEKISNLKKTRSFDLVEYNTSLDKNKKDLKLIKKILKLFSN